jgi:hypothetical protein
VSTSDVTLGSGYWSARNGIADLRITVVNTGRVPESVLLRYTLPPGVSDTGTAGCSAAGGRTYRCAARTTGVGARSTTHVRVRVDPDAWRQMPLSGLAEVVATAASRPPAETVTDKEGFAVLFPAGPPAAGVSLSASEVSFDITGQATMLDVRLGNTGKSDATGAVAVILPPGVTVPLPPAGCQPAGADRTRCDLGTIRAGQAGSLRIPLAATLEAQRRAPLSGAVVGTLTPGAGGAKQVQLSFRIVAAAGRPELAGDQLHPSGSPALIPPVSRTKPADDSSNLRQRAAALIAVSVLLVLLAVLAATTSRQGTPARPAGDENRP